VFLYITSFTYLKTLLNLSHLSGFSNEEQQGRKRSGEEWLPNHAVARKTDGRGQLQIPASHAEPDSLWGRWLRTQVSSLATAARRSHLRGPDRDETRRRLGQVRLLIIRPDTRLCVITPTLDFALGIAPDAIEAQRSPSPTLGAYPFRRRRLGEQSCSCLFDVGTSQHD
jgi:hypothetical protein